MNRNLIIVRHGLAEDRDVFSKTGLNDKDRPLTKEGLEKMKLVSSWLDSKINHKANHKLNPKIDYLCESPLLRSKQTVDVLSKKISFLNRVELKSLDPKNSVEALAESLDDMVWSNLIIVGHEPQLSLFLSYILGVSSAYNHGAFKFKKGGVAFVKTKGKLVDRKAELSLLVAPKHII